MQLVSPFNRIQDPVPAFKTSTRNLREIKNRTESNEAKGARENRRGINRSPVGVADRGSFVEEGKDVARRVVVGNNRKGMGPYLLYEYTRRVRIVILRINLSGKRNPFQAINRRYPIREYSELGLCPPPVN